MLKLPGKAPEGVVLISLRERESGRVLIVGHRGAEALAPENTWASLKAGCESGADMLEVDVQLTSDGEAIVFHDYTLQPKFGDPRWVRDLAWAELRAFDVGRWFAPRFAGERIPRLADVLAWARERVALWVDLKHGFVEHDDDGLEKAAVEMIVECSMIDQVVVSSWDQVALSRIRVRYPRIPLAVNLRPRVPDPVSLIRPTGASWVAVWWPQIDRETVARLQAGGLTVCLTNLFTADYAEAYRLGVDAVTAEDPSVARTALVASRCDQERRMPHD